jgi:hypothetical protein
VAEVARALGTRTKEETVNAARASGPVTWRQNPSLLPAGDSGGHQPAQPLDFGVPRLQHRLDDVYRGMDGGLQIPGDAITQETAR